MMRDRTLCILNLAAAVLLAACSPKTIQQSIAVSLQVRSSTLVSGVIPDRCGCRGAGISPQVAWSDPPAGTRSFVVIMDDPDFIVGHTHRRYFAHWVAFDLRADRRELAEGITSQALSADERQGTNDLGKPGYAGPCPKTGDTHHYAITVYALDTTLGLPATTNGWHLLTAIDGHILARGQVIGTYTH
jgi:Raf kinase inhibitor-like YbhB/YbcL family protein